MQGILTSLEVGARVDQAEAAELPPIIAIGASAGGLDPLEDFFRAAPTNAGWVFFVLQHLSPDFRSMMDELLARHTSLTISVAQHGVEIEPNTVYLNPPNTIVTLERNRIELQPFDPDQRPNMPIDAFFYSLAAQHPPHGYAVVLSGSGADGARGAAAMQRRGSKVVVQAPGSARFDSMPRAVIASGAVNRVLEAHEMPRAIAEMIERQNAGDIERPPKLPRDPYEAILALIERHHRIDFRAYKKATVTRRIERRFTLRGIGSVEDYLELLKSDSDALDQLYQDMLIGVTEFFRDRDAFAALERQVLDRICEQEDRQEIRIWVPACASGEEVYSIAIALSECQRKAGIDRGFRIIATDVHRPSVEHAAVGVYSRASLENMPEELLERYFEPHPSGFEIDAPLRQKVIFSVHDALNDPPFMRLDLVSCRNLLIYLDDQAQSRILSMFLFGLKKDGFLFLGKSESIGSHRTEFATVDSQARIFRKQTDRRFNHEMMATTTFSRGEGVSNAVSRREMPGRPPIRALDNDTTRKRDRSELLRGYDALLKRHAPSSILIGERNEVVTWFGNAGAYIDTLSDLAERTVEEIVDHALQYPINVGIERIRRRKDRSYRRTVTVSRQGMADHKVAVQVEPLMGEGEEARFILVLLDDGSGAGRPHLAPEEGEDAPMASGDEAFLAGRIRELERDLTLTEESLQYVTERLETSGEELQASNEELQASNEELQASNEELQASNEELHAVNEELVSVSSEHQRKIEELTTLSTDLEFVFSTLSLGVVLFDADLKLRRYTHFPADLFGLMPHDIERPVTTLGIRLDFVDVIDLVRRVSEGGGAEVLRGEHQGAPLVVRATCQVVDGEAGRMGRRTGERSTVLVFARPQGGTAQRGLSGDVLG